MASDRSMARGTQPKEPSALDRLKSLEIRFGRVVQQTEAVLNDLNRRLGEVTSVMNAAVQLLGVEAIQAKVKENYVAHQEARADEEERLVAEQVAAGGLVQVEVINPEKPGTLVVTSESGADGEQHYPTRNFVPFAAFGNVIQDLLKAAKPGDTVVFPEYPEGQEAPEGYEVGTQLKILALYEVAEPKVAEETPAEAPAPESAPVPEVEGASETASS